MKLKKSTKSKIDELFEFDMAAGENAPTKSVIILGTDEAGRGPGAGPVFAAAVCFITSTDSAKPLNTKSMGSLPQNETEKPSLPTLEELKESLATLNDSKQLSEKHREELFEILTHTEGCVWSIAEGTVEEIETCNILNTSLNCMKRSCEDVLRRLEAEKFITGQEHFLDSGVTATRTKWSESERRSEKMFEAEKLITGQEHFLDSGVTATRTKWSESERGSEKMFEAEKFKVLVDGNKKIKNFAKNGVEIPQETVVKGDSKSAAIAAASILAKVARDRLMLKLAQDFPEYGWERNKGYLTAEHVDAIKKHGATTHHRPKFLRNILGGSKAREDTTQSKTQKQSAQLGLF